MRQYYFLRACSFFLLMFFVTSAGQAKTVTYTVSTRTSVTTTGDVPAGSSATFKNTNASGTINQMVLGSSMTLTLTGFDSTTITGLTLSMKSNTKAGAGSSSMTCGTKSLASISDAQFNNTSWNGAWSTSFVDINPTVTSYTVGSNEQIVINISASQNSLYCQYFTITYEDPGVAKTPTVTSFGAGAQNSYDAFIGESFTAPTATVDNSGTVTYGSSSTSVATVDPATGAVTLVAPGSTTITASYDGNDTYYPSSASYVLNVGGVYNSIQELQAGATTTLTKAKITFNNVYVTGLKNGSNFYVSDGIYGATVNSTSTVTKGQVLNGTFTADVQLSYGATTIKNFLISSVTATNETLTPVITTIPEIQIANQGRYVTLNNVTFNATAKTFTDASNSTIANYAGLQTNPTLVDGVTYNITGVANAYNTSVEIMPEIAEALPASASISAAGYATFVAPFDINATAADVTVYTINTVSSASATLTPVTLIPKGTVVLLKGSAGTHSLSSDATQTYTALTGNLLKAAPAGGLTILDTDNIYLLGMPSGQPVGFYKSTAGTLAAGKGYLDGGSIAAGKFLSFTDEATGIDKVNTTTIENNAIYNLNGQKISAPVKGINVINGKKVLIK